MRTAVNDMVLSLGTRLKRSLQRRRTRFVTGEAWRRRHRKVFQLHPEYSRPCPRGVEKDHLELWRQLRRDVNANTLRVCYNISGRADPEIVPEEVFASEIEPALNRHDECVFLANKSFYNRWFPGDLFPEAYLHNIEGSYYSGDYLPLNSAGVTGIIDRIAYPVVIKSSLGRGGGRDVDFPQDRTALEALMKERRNFVVQDLVKPHEFFRKYNSHGLNTLRVCTYRSVATGDVHVLNAALRMGKGGSLDNLTQGGIVRFIHEDGRLNDYALDKYGQKFFAHPDTGLDFRSRELIPQFDELKQLARTVAQDIYLARLVSFDCALDEAGRWRVIEINLANQTIRFAQYAGRPFFGPFTQEVMDYCRDNPRWA